MASGPWDNVQPPGPPNGPAWVQAAANMMNATQGGINNAANQYQNWQNFNYTDALRNFFQNPQNKELLQQNIKNPLLQASVQQQGIPGLQSIMPYLMQGQALSDANRVANPEQQPPLNTGPATNSSASGPENIHGNFSQPDSNNYNAGLAPNVRQMAIDAGIDPTSPQFKKAFAGINIDRGLTNQSVIDGAQQRIDALKNGSETPNSVPQSGGGDQESKGGRAAASGQLNPSMGEGSSAQSPRQTGERRIAQEAAQSAPFTGGYAPPSAAEIRRYEASGNRNIAASRTPGLSKEQADAYRNQGDQDRETAKQLRKEREEWQRTPTNPDVNRAAVEKKAKEDELAADNKMIAEIADAGLTARGHVAQLETIKKLGEKVGYGVIPKVQSFLGQHGISTQGLSDIQAYERAIDYMAPQLRPIGSGRLMAQELNAFKASLGGLMTTPDGREISVENLQLVAKYQDTIGKIARDKTISIEQRIKKIDDVPAPHLKTLDDIVPTGKGSPPMQGARQAPDGFWYVPDPNRQGKYLRVQQ